MTIELSFVIFFTAEGWLGILGSAHGLVRSTTPQPWPQKALGLLGEAVEHASNTPRLFEDLMHRLRLYFDGYRVTFPDKLDLSWASSFQRQVWETTRLIPYGETRSYSWMAKQIGKPKGGRVVGQALGHNPLPIIIPCHRVLRSNGNLGGYGGGVAMKQRLLYLETTRPANGAGVD